MYTYIYIYIYTHMYMYRGRCGEGGRPHVAYLPRWVMRSIW